MCRFEFRIDNNCLFLECKIGLNWLKKFVFKSAKVELC